MAYQCQETEQAQTSRLKYRGQAVIIVNEKFHVEGRLTRHGATSDLKKMAAVFKALDFKVLTFKDQTAAEMLNKITTACDDVNNDDSEYFSLVISSHGEEDFHENSDEDRKWLVLGSDCQPVKINQLIEIIRKSNGLKNKPKLVFIQACRSRKNSDTVFDRGVSVDVAVPCTCHCQPSDAVDVTDEALMKLVKEQAVTTTCDMYRDWPDVPGQWLDDEVNSCTTTMPPAKKPRRTISEEYSEELRSVCTIAPSTSQSSGSQHEAGISLDEETSSIATTHTGNVTVGGQNPAGLEIDTLTQIDTQRLEPRIRRLPTQQVAPHGLHGELPVPTVTPSGPLVTQPEPQPLAPTTQQTGDQVRPQRRGTQFVQQGPQVVSAEQEIGQPAQQDPEPGPPQVSGSDSFVEQIVVPDNFLVVCPAMSGKVAYRQSDSGSRLFHSMYRKEHMKVLLEGGDILRYLTLVAKDIASQENIIDNVSFKTNICIQHRLCQKVRFNPMKENSPMDIVKREFV